MLRPLITLPLLAALACAYPATQTPEAGTAEILWDDWGVPHIFAGGAEELFHAFGWAQAHDHGDLILRLYGEARGRAAEYWGEEHLPSDRWVRTMGIPARAARWYEAQNETARAYVDAYAQGINDYAAAHPEALDEGMTRVLPVSGADVLAHVQRVIHFTFVVDQRQIAGAANDLDMKGSNAWAIAPERSASGNSILVANPHLPWSDLFTWHEAQLTSPEVDVYGAALVGSAFLGVAFNNHLGWSHSVNTQMFDDLVVTNAEGEPELLEGFEGTGLGW